MFAETLSIGLVVPVLTLITQPDIAINHPIIHSWVIALFGTQPHYIYVVCILLAFMILQVTKSIFIGYLSFKQAQFAFNAQKNLSYTMFELYLKKPITFHLQRNSSQMVNNVITEVVIFRDTLLLLLMLIAELLVVLGMVLLALILEPVGTIVVFSFVVVIGSIYQLITKDFISRQAYIRQHNDALKIMHLQQGLRSIKEIKVLGCENEFLNRFQMPNLKSANAGANYFAMGNKITNMQVVPRPAACRRHTETTTDPTRLARHDQHHHQTVCSTTPKHPTYNLRREMYHGMMMEMQTKIKNGSGLHAEPGCLADSAHLFMRPTTPCQGVLPTAQPGGATAQRMPIDAP